MSISNSCKFIGRLAREPELKFLPGSGKAVVNFALAVPDDFDYKDSDKTFFIDCVAWQKTAEFIANNAQKGKLIAIEGKMGTDKWQDKEGNNRYKNKLIIEGVKIIEWRDKGDQGQNQHNSHGYQSQSHPEHNTDTQNTQQQQQQQSQQSQQQPNYQNDLNGFQAIDGDSEIPF